MSIALKHVPGTARLSASVAALFLMVIAPGIVRAQEAASASIAGHIADETGAPVPEAAVSVCSPAFQVGTVTAVTDKEGNYQVIYLPAPGVAGVKGMTIEPGLRVLWRDTENRWQTREFGGAVNRNPVTLQAANRIVVVEGKGGSIAAFPPAHNLSWAPRNRF